jgi:uncharacterized OB-fold protein
MTGTAPLHGTVQSHTVIRVPGKQHAAAAPFVLLLVELDDGKRMLGHFRGHQPPPISSRVVSDGTEGETPIFHAVGEES